MMFVQKKQQLSDVRNLFTAMNGQCAPDTCGIFMSDADSTSPENVSCDVVCGDGGSHTFRPILVTRDVFLNGRRPPREGVYCVRDGTNVTRCNTATSTLVAGDGGRWSCHPRWPALFGGEDGGDILVCGGRLNDGPQAYRFRLPPSDRLAPIRNPYEEVDRFNCTPGLYVDGPRDYMNNEYVRLPANRFHRIRNNCAKYVANAGDLLAPVTGNDAYCNCLATHGRLRRASQQKQHDGDEKRGDRKKRDANDGESSATSDSFQVAYACSPCAASGDLTNTKGVFNFPVACTKSNRKYFNRRRSADNMPCGRVGFTSAAEPSCVNTWIYVGHEGMSHLVQRAIANLTK